MTPTDTQATHEVALDLTPRLQAAARAVADARDTYRAETERRDALILRAADEGMSTVAISKAAELSRARVIHIQAEAAGE